jgi:hypothetical protein
MIVHLVQFLRPNGRQVPVECDVPDSLRPQVEAIRERGFRFTSEVLMTDHVSLAIEHPTYGDFDGQICRNGLPEPGVTGSTLPDPKEGLIALITRFRPSDADVWLAADAQAGD